MRLNVLAFATTCAAIWGIGLFSVTLWIVLWDGQSADPTLIGHVYRGYSLTVAGSLVGLIWALADGFVGGTIFAWLYNLLWRRFARA